MSEDQIPVKVRDAHPTYVLNGKVEADEPCVHAWVRGCSSGVPDEVCDVDSVLGGESRIDVSLVFPIESQLHGHVVGFYKLCHQTRS